MVLKPPESPERSVTPWTRIKLFPFDRKGRSMIRSRILRAGARRLIAQAVEAEFETFLASNAELVLSDGRRRVVRHGHDPVRAIQTGIGPVDVQKPKARDRGATTGARIRFTSHILPKWARRTKSLDALLPPSTCAGFPRATSRRPFPHCSA